MNFCCAIFIWNCFPLTRAGKGHKIWEGTFQAKIEIYSKFLEYFCATFVQFWGNRMEKDFLEEIAKIRHFQPP